MSSEPTRRSDLRTGGRLPASDDPQIHTGAARASDAAAGHTETPEGKHEQGFENLPKIPTDYKWVHSLMHCTWYLIHDKNLFPVISLRDEYVTSVHPSLLQEQTDYAIRHYMGG